MFPQARTAASQRNHRYAQVTGQKNVRDEGQSSVCVAHITYQAGSQVGAETYPRKKAGLMRPLGATAGSRWRNSALTPPPPEAAGPNEPF